MITLIRRESGEPAQRFMWDDGIKKRYKLDDAEVRVLKAGHIVTRGPTQFQLLSDEEQPPAFRPETAVILVIGCNGHWAKGETLDEAVKNAARPKRYIAFIAHADTTIDDFGGACYPMGYAPKVISRHGFKEPKQ